MRVVVNDANVLIDIVELELLPPFFSLEFQMTTIDIVLEELLDEQQEALRPYVEAGRLEVCPLSGTDMVEVFTMRTQHARLSEQDCSAFLKARQLGAILLTGDNALRRLAQRENQEVHGHLWLFDRLVESEILSPARAKEKLKVLCDVINPRLGLPKEEVERRLIMWGEGEDEG